MSSLQLDHVRKAFTNLKKLHLHLVLDDHTRGKRWGALECAPFGSSDSWGTSISPEIHTNATECLIQILTAARGLHTLELAIDYYFWKDALDGALSFHRLLKPQTWPALCTVHFRGKTLTPCALVPFIRRHCRIVRHLTIQNTKFFEDAEWMDVFQSLSRENLKLNVLHLGPTPITLICFFTEVRPPIASVLTVDLERKAGWKRTRHTELLSNRFLYSLIYNSCSRFNSTVISSHSF